MLPNSPPKTPALLRQIRRGMALLVVLLGVGWAAERVIAADVPLVRPRVDEAQATARGLRKLVGKHLTLWTDLPPRPEVESLPEVFDQAVPQYCDYFGLDPAERPNWRVTGFLMKDRQRFQELGLLPAGLPPFETGYSWDDLVWVCEQSTDYYRRHLLLHEGVHSFMKTQLGAFGSPWYMEGVAELLATHRWQDGRLTLNTMPRRTEDVPLWGRIGVLRKAVAAGSVRSLPEVIGYQPDGRTEAEDYAWCWGLVALLDGDPAYRTRFRTLPKQVKQPDFNGHFDELFAADQPQLLDQWQVFLADLEYGMDLAADAIQFRAGAPLPADGATVAVAANRGWQSSGVLVKAGTRYAVRANGRFQVAADPQPWSCEAGGVSIRYYHGRPLGMLLAAVRPEAPSNANSRLAFEPIPVGVGVTLLPDVTGTLYLRINDSAAELADNSGSLQVEIRAEKP